jgi:hypothetical protein
MACRSLLLLLLLWLLLLLLLWLAARAACGDIQASPPPAQPQPNCMPR